MKPRVNEKITLLRNLFFWVYVKYDETKTLVNFETFVYTHLLRLKTETRNLFLKNPETFWASCLGTFVTLRLREIIFLINLRKKLAG